jgi:hypothetical protein
MPPDREDPRVDELRQRLRSLGYLDAGVDRFVLGPAVATRRPIAIASLAGIRIGALAGLLMGPAAAIGIAARMPGLIMGPRDGFIVAAYLGVLFGATAFIAALGAAVLVSGMAGRGERVRRAAAAAAGFVITGASLAYLTLWWDASTLSAQSRSWGTLWTIVALAFAAAISLLIGHAVTLASLAVSVARGASGAERGVPGASKPVMAAAGVLTFCGALLLFSLTSAAGRDQTDAPPIAVVSSGLRVRVVAIDGFDPDVAKRLADAGAIPVLANALGLTPGTRDPSSIATARATIEIEDTKDPARAWTTIATGQTADQHAVRGLETRRVFGLQGSLAAGEPSPLVRALATASDLIRLTRPSIASRDERRVKTLWEAAAGAGLRTAVVNWWATWPAPAEGGIVISDRAILRLERGGELDAEIAPPALYQMLRARWAALRTRAAEEASLVRSTAASEPLLRRSAELDALQLAVTREAAQPGADLVCTYLPGLDLVQHGLLGTFDGSTPSPSSMAAKLADLEAYYTFLDRLLAQPLAVANDEIVMVLTSPGRVHARTSGLFALRGAAANRLVRDAVGRPIDIAPTVLHALGIPISRELPGRPLVELLSADFARRYPVREVATYGKPAGNQVPRGGQPLDQEMIDRLRSLGYVR